eukprot:CFRG4324T1
MKRIEAQYGWNKFRTLAVVLAVITLILGLTSLLSTSWITNDVSVTAFNPEISKFAFGPLRTCYTIHNINETSLNVTLDDECRTYGNDIGDDFPDITFFITSFLLASGSGTMVFVCILAAISVYKQTDRLSASSALIAVLCFVAALFVFPGGFGGTFTNNSLTTGSKTEINVCGDSSSYDIGRCQLSWGTGTAIAAAIVSIGVFVMLCLSEREEKANSARRSYKTGGYL